MSKPVFRSEEISAIVARQRAHKSAKASAQIARASRFSAARCDCGTPAGFHTSDCAGHR